MKLAIIEDSTMMVSLWNNFLGGSEYTGFFFGSVPTELERLREYAPDLIICPGVPRHQPAARLVGSIKSSPELRGSRLIVATSFNEQELHRRWELAQIDSVLLKPFTREHLLALLDRFQSQSSIADRDLPLAVVVDDSQVARSVLESEMRGLGFRVMTAVDGKAGLDLILEVLPDIALTDVEMPGKTGLELCTELSQNPRTCRLPIIVISSTINDNEIRRGFNSGAIDFLPKPVDAAHLARVVSSVLGRNVTSRGGNVLVLEDEPTAASIVMKLFAELGLASIVYNGIAEFQTHLSITTPELIALDLNLREGDILGLCRSLRQMDSLKTVPIVVISSPEQRDRSVECLRSGANDFLEKPFTREEFLARVKNLQSIKGLQNELVQKYKVLEDLAYHDALTGLLNRRYLDIGLERELERSRSSGDALSFILVDLDHFKKVNDTYGHETGDEILKAVAALIKGNIRNIDLACRYGGEELCVILPRCSLGEAAEIAERLRSVCSASKFTAQLIRQTISIGVSGFPEPSSEKLLVKDADAALYKAKSGGRNRVMLCP